LSTRSTAKVSWIGPLYLATAGLLTVAALVGWYIGSRSILSTRDKRRKMIAIYFFIVTMIVILVVLAIIFSTSIAYSVKLEADGVEPEVRGSVACFIDNAGGCTRCEEVDFRCPEWTNDDVITVLQSQAKNSATLAAIFLIYVVAALRFGIATRKHVTMYQIDYV